MSLTLIFVAAALVTASYAEDGVTGIKESVEIKKETKELIVGTSQTIAEIEGQILDNANALFPMFMHEDIIYFPTSWGALKSIGYTKEKNYETGELRLSKVDKVKLNSFERASEGKKVTDIKLSEVDYNIYVNGSNLRNKEYPAFEYQKVVYIPLTYDVLAQFGWSISHRDQVATVISSKGFNMTSARVKEISEETKVDYYSDLAQYMMKINKELPKERADFYVDLIKENSEKYGIDEIWIFCMMWLESNFDETCDTKGAYGHALGLMQIMDSTGRNMGLSWEQLLDPAISVEYAMKYLVDDLDYLNNDIELATIAYNQGITRVRKGTYNRNYLDWVLNRKNKIEAFLEFQDYNRQLAIAE
jgi:hypothetical protein